MLSFLRKSLSGDKAEGEPSAAPATDPSLTSKPGLKSVSTDEQAFSDDNGDRKGKRFLSGEAVCSTNGANKQKNKKLRRAKNAEEISGEDPDGVNVNEESDIRKDLLPEGTPDWGIKMLEILQGEFRSMSNQLSLVDSRSVSNAIEVKQMVKKLQIVEQKNMDLEEENTALKERLIDLEYRQRRNNLIFDGITDANKETEIQCMNKLRQVLAAIPGLNVENFKIDRCHRIDGKFNVNSNCRIVCCFNWYYDVQCILKIRKLLPKDVFVSEDLPEGWIDRRRVLKPIFNAARRVDNLKERTLLNKDKLIIDGKTYTAKNVLSLMSQGCVKGRIQKRQSFWAFTQFSVTCTCSVYCRECPLQLHGADASGPESCFP